MDWEERNEGGKDMYKINLYNAYFDAFTNLKLYIIDRVLQVCVLS